MAPIELIEATVAMMKEEQREAEKRAQEAKISNGVRTRRRR